MTRATLIVSAVALAGALGCGGRESGTNASTGGVGSGTATNGNSASLSCPGNCALLGAVCDTTTGLCVGSPGASASGGSSATVTGDASPLGAINCFPAAGSCDGPPPQLSPLDTIHGCLSAPIPVPGLCSTSANRCNENSGLALDCAFSPDGGVFVGLTSDNYVVTGNGWAFVEPPSAPIPAMVPANEVEALPTFVSSCGEDAGQPDSADDDAATAAAGPLDEPPSCQPGGPGMTNCGAGGSGVQSCCTSPEVPGGTFYRNYDGVTNSQMDGKATLSPLRIDKYEITVGRFRQFVSASANGWVPAPGSGKHAHLNGGRGLVNSADPTGSTYEPGWDSSWNQDLATTEAGWASNLSCNGFATWTSSPAADENRPLNCVDWYEVYAFCIWDGGFLPSDAEWNFAASGGGEQRVFPWSVPPKLINIDCTYANYGGDGLGLPSFCSPDRTNDVGSESPKGDGKWGHSDLGGNVWEWVLDYGTGGPCIDCAYTSPPPSGPPPAPPDPNAGRVNRGGGLGAAFSLETSSINGSPPTDRDIEHGARCARAP